MSAINKRANLSALESDPLRNFRYVVKMTPYWDATQSDAKTPEINNLKFGFTSVSGLSVATEAIPYREGGMNTTLHQIPGQTTFSPVTLSRGVHLGNSQGWDWMRRLFSVTGSASGSTNEINFRAVVDIHVLQHPVNRRNDANESDWANEEQSSDDDLTGVSFRLYNAWLQSLAYSDLNAGDNAVLVEQMVMAHEGFDMRWPTGEKYDQNDMKVVGLNATATSASTEAYWRWDHKTGNIKVTT